MGVGEEHFQNEFGVQYPSGRVCLSRIIHKKTTTSLQRDPAIGGPDDVAISFNRKSYPTEIATLPSVARDDVPTNCHGISLSL